MKEKNINIRLETTLRTKFLGKVTGRTRDEANRILYRNATWKSWKNQDYCLSDKKTDYNLFKKGYAPLVWH